MKLDSASGRTTAAPPRKTLALGKDYSPFYIEFALTSEEYFFFDCLTFIAGYFKD